MENINLEQEFEELWSRTPKQLIGNFLWASKYLKPLAKWFWIEGRKAGMEEARSSFKIIF